MSKQKDKLSELLQSLILSELIDIAKALGITGISRLRKQELIEKLIERKPKKVIQFAKRFTSYSSNSNSEKNSLKKTNYLYEIKNKIHILLGRISTTFYVLLIFTVILIACFFIFNSNTFGKINGEIISGGDVELSYGTPQNPLDSTEMRVSPLCGCAVVKPHRGVEFFSNEFHIKSINNTDSTLSNFFFIGAPDNGEISATGAFYFNVKYFLIEDSYLNHNSLLDLYNTKLKKPNIPIIESTEIARLVAAALINNSGELSVYNLTDFQVAALIPMKDSKIGIYKQLEPYFREYSQLFISEDYYFDSWEKQNDKPLLDILGQRIALVSEPAFSRLVQKMAQLF